MIAKTFTDSFAKVKKLVDNFHKHIDEYLKPKYQEAEVRQDFLDKFFVALGWDVYHLENQNPYEREVRIEKSVMVQGRGKRADYAFYTAPNFTQARFMAEAKKPSKQLENAQDCFQAIRYGWNSNTPIVVLTDFEQFLVLDSRYKPTIETAMQRIIREKSFRYTDFADEEKFREIYYLFSREAVINNSLETFAKGLKGGRGARQSKLSNTSIIQPMDEEFLSELDEQRVVLAKAFKNRNAELDGETLTEITQRTLDRLVFLRFLEDKLVEPDSVIDNLGKKSGSAWRDFIGEMPRLNSIYNGTLFRSHSVLDAPDFAPDARAFEQTRDWLSHFNSPYDFNSIPIHILGSIYERFLGKTIVATGKRATVEDKPEVRKAGGVYYTPEYIVRYIVENTIGKLLNGGNPRVSKGADNADDENTLTNVRISAKKKKPEEIAEMRFADIACGSGSFLLGVFDYLIAYHVEYFSENKTRREKAVKDGLCRETIEGVLQLTINYKREILLNNIYGVDLDAQAVEVAQLSLYLKLLEEETTATKQQFLAGFREQLLPKLDKNIVHGNSLIDYDIMDGMLFDTRELKQLNPMNFQSTFPEVFQKGGFDAIVGNPPYIRIQTMRETSPFSVEYFKDKYISARKGNYDIYVAFVEKALSLLNENGKLGYILPHKFFNAKYGEGLRGEIAKGKNLAHVVHFGDQQVFNGATTYTCLLHLNKKETPEFEFIKADDLAAWRDEKQFVSGKISAATVSESEWNFTVGEGSELLEKINKLPIKLGDISHIFVGLQTDADDVFILEQIRVENDKALCFSKATQKEHWFEINHLKDFLKGSLNIRRYFLSDLTKKLIFPYETLNEKSHLIQADDYKEKFPLTWNYLVENKSRLSKRNKGQLGLNWYGYVYKKNHTRFDGVKLLVPAIANQNTFAIDQKGKFYFVGSGGGGGGGYGIKLNSEISDYYILGILNSKLLTYFLKSVSTPFRGGYFALNRQFIEQIPIRTIDFSQPKEKAAHDKIVELAAKMLEAKKSLANAQTDKDKTFYERYCSSLDTQIDALVYDLYDLSADERKIIENS